MIKLPLMVYWLSHHFDGFNMFKSHILIATSFKISMFHRFTLLMGQITRLTGGGLEHFCFPAFGLPNLGFAAVLLLLIQHGFQFYDLLSTLPEVGGRQRRPL